MQIEHKYYMGSGTTTSVYYSTYCKSVELSLTERNGTDSHVVSLSLSGERMEKFVNEVMKIKEEIDNQKECEGVDTD